ncbi:putative protein S-acyltransferase 16 [Zea mays]|uniref:S-acyltransferase n=1 Tax=Zea mays TaxID=4577 RepID=A0A1D6N7D6_MAIZE|nr:putative protein S-acyltransferase 16 [Zea mays]
MSTTPRCSWRSPRGWGSPRRPGSPTPRSSARSPPPASLPTPSPYRATRAACQRPSCPMSRTPGAPSTRSRTLQGGDLRYCQKCSHYKPPRAHHCRACKRCVLRMVHHCIWINNCVGHENYKIFLVFVMYAVIASFYSMVLIIGGAVHLPKDEQPSSDSSRTSIVVCGVLLCPLALALMVLLGWHVYLILHNKTTIEYHEGVRATWLAEKAGNVYHHPYNLGIYENLV